MICTADYEDKEIIVVDNASTEEGTAELLDELEAMGVVVFRQKERDPSNEFAKALNLIVENARGDYVIPLQGDMQFIVQGGWLDKFVKLFEKRSEYVGCIMLDAQRRVTNTSHVYGGAQNIDGFVFKADFSRTPTCAAGDVMYSKAFLNEIGPWKITNANHEGGDDSETDFLNRTKKANESRDKKWLTFMPFYPVSAAIYTDPRGTMARVRGSRRYGSYWRAKDDLYYSIRSEEEVEEAISDSGHGFGFPIPIEEAVRAHDVNFDLPIDDNGCWMKNPIRPGSASESDYEEI